MMRRLIFGCGYLGCRVAELWRASGDQVCVVSRNADRVESFEQYGFETIQADGLGIEFQRRDRMLDLSLVAMLDFECVGSDQRHFMVG